MSANRSHLYFADLDSRHNVGKTGNVGSDFAGEGRQSALESVHRIEQQRRDHAKAGIGPRLPAAQGLVHGHALQGGSQFFSHHGHVSGQVIHVKSAARVVGINYVDSDHPHYYRTLKSIRAGLTMVAAGMAAVVAARMLFGPFRLGPVSVITPLNPEGFFGLAVTALLLTRTSANPAAPRGRRLGVILMALGVAAISIVALRRALGVYFLSDDFILVRFGSEWTAAAFRHAMTHGGGDGFFRPLGYASLALDARLSGSNPMGWHAISLAIHSANAVLVLLMARRLGASIAAAGFAGALFAVHGIHPEAVVWIAGRFDLVATFFLLAGLFLFTMTGGRNRISPHVAALACFALAALTKEAAFIFPLLVAGYALAKRQSLRPTAWYFALAATLFAYRWSLFGGIGGYVNPATGRPAALSLGWGSTLKAVAVRLWTSLYFPLNWSRDASLPLLLALLAVAYMAAILWLGARSRPTRMIWLAAASILVCTIPVLSLLAGSAALAGSRVLYLPSVWFAILLALAVDGVPGRVRYLAAAVVLLFQFAMLQHNLGFWEAASSQVKTECATGAPALPDSIDGVPALANGRQECIQAGRNGLSRP